MKREKGNRLIKKKNINLFVPLVESFSELRAVTNYWGSAINVDVGRLRVHGICSCRMVHREVPELCSNNDRFTSGDWEILWYWDWE